MFCLFTSVTVYDCRGLVNDCSQCKVLDKAKFQCEWCTPGSCDFVGSSSCTTLQACPYPTFSKVFSFVRKSLVASIGSA